MFFDKQICATELYLLPMLHHAYDIIIEHTIAESLHGKYDYDGLNIIFSNDL